MIFLGNDNIPYTLACGDSRLSAQANLPWLKWILWLLPAGVVITTGKMALNLFRDMRAS